MNIRFVLLPWWVRTAYIALATFGWVFAIVVFFRYKDGRNANPFSLPAPGIVLIAVACVCIAGLLAAVAGQQRDRYQRVLQPVPTPAGRSQAITAVRRGPVPDDPRVRQAARQMAQWHLAGYHKNREKSRIIYPVIVLLQLPILLIDCFEHHYLDALIPTLLAGTFAYSFASAGRMRRRLGVRIALLDPARISDQGGCAPTG